MRLALGTNRSSLTLVHAWAHARGIVAKADLDAQLSSLSRGCAELLRQLVARRAERRALSVGVLQRRAHGGKVVLELAVTLGGDRRMLFARGDLPRAVRRASTQP
jgi:hypothetical protein